MEAAVLSRIGLAGLAVMGQNLALNVAEKGFPISVYNRTASKVDDTVARAADEGGLPLSGHYTPRDFVLSIARPRSVLILVKAGAPVDQTIAALSQHLEPGDAIVDGGNEWYENTERRAREAEARGLLYLGMGVSGGEEGARRGPSLMPGGSHQAYLNIQDILTRVAAQVDDGPCVTYVGPGGAGNFVKMVHNGIEYGDMQLISEAYDVLRTVGGLSNQDLAEIFADWNRGELESFLIEITADIFRVKDEHGEGELVDKILDKTGMKGTGKWTVQQAAELSVAAPTIAASLDCRYLSGLKEERESAARALEQAGMVVGPIRKVDGKQLVDDVRQALYASKICSYAQGMNLLRAKSEEKGWGLNLGELARIWKGGCIIRARFLDRIKRAYERNRGLPNLVVDPEFAREMVQRQGAWRRVVGLAVEAGISTPGMCASLAYFDTYRRARLPANLLQAQRDLFGAHTYERVDRPGSFHTEWTKLARQSEAGAPAGAFN
uniref:6-phosphogluconate dehydrogenase, decarboxylating n=1 Tax=Anthurium amnicola TaxID=1678845 RepID=A0A1D1Z4I9_9ARAE